MMILDVDKILTPLISYNIFTRNIALSLQIRMAALTFFQKTFQTKIIMIF